MYLGNVSKSSLFGKVFHHNWCIPCELTWYRHWQMPFRPLSPTPKHDLSSTCLLKKHYPIVFYLEIHAQSGTKQHNKNASYVVLISMTLNLQPPSQRKAKLLKALTGNIHMWFQDKLQYGVFSHEDVSYIFHLISTYDYYSPLIILRFYLCSFMFNS